MNPMITEFQNLLSEHLLGHPYNENSVHEERFLIDHLVELTEDWGLGSVSYSDLRKEFRSHDIPGFDLDNWIHKKHSEGHIFLPEELTQK